VTFPKDCEFISRHAQSQCDLHTTTDIVLRPEINANCAVPIETGISPKCCTSNPLLKKSNHSTGKWTPAEASMSRLLKNTRMAARLIGVRCTTIPTHKESIQLLSSLTKEHSLENSRPRICYYAVRKYLHSGGYIQKIIHEYVELGVDPKDVWRQSFNSDDAICWVNNSDFGD